MRLLQILALSFLVLAAGCPKEKRALNIARKSVEISAQTVQLADLQVSFLYQDAAETCLASWDTRASYDACIAKWDKTVLAVNAMKISLLSLETALDAWEAGSPNGRDNLLGAAACFVETMVNVQSLLAVLGTDVPAINQGLATVSGMFGEGGIACPQGVTP